MINSQPILPLFLVSISSPSLQACASPRGFVCVPASLATVPLGCAGPTAIADRQRCATGLHTPPWLLSPSLSFHCLRCTASLYHSHPPLQRRRLTYLAVSLLIQKTSKQMRRSPVQRCRPAAHASCQETPRTCWLCTFPEKHRQM